MKKMIKYICFFLLFFIFLQMIHYQKENSQQKEILQKVFPKQQQSQWNQIEGKYSNVYYQKEKNIAEMIQRQADSYYAMIAKDFHWQRTQKIDFILFEKKEVFERSFFYEKTLPMGVYYKGVIGIISPNLWDIKQIDWKKVEYFLEKGPVVHEMIHFAVDEKTKGNCHRFLTEGIALYYERKYTGFLWEIEEEKKKKQMTKEELEKEFYGEEFSIAYWKSYEWVKKFVECYGEGMLQRALEEKGMTVR